MSRSACGYMYAEIWSIKNVRSCTVPADQFQVSVQEFGPGELCLRVHTLYGVHIYTGRHEPVSKNTWRSVAITLLTRDEGCSWRDLCSILRCGGDPRDVFHGYDDPGHLFINDVLKSDVTIEHLHTR